MGLQHRLLRDHLHRREDLHIKFRIRESVMDFTIRRSSPLRKRLASSSFFACRVFRLLFRLPVRLVFVRLFPLRFSPRFSPSFRFFACFSSYAFCRFCLCFLFYSTTFRSFALFLASNGALCSFRLASLSFPGDRLALFALRFCSFPSPLSRPIFSFPRRSYFFFPFLLTIPGACATIYG